MRKALLLVSILFVSVVSTACINNFAVQELNSKAKIYLEEGNYTEAIERLKSSIDLDDTIFETHYNLAVAYTQAEDYANAIDSYKEAIALDDSVPDAYYSLAVAEGNLAIDLANGSLRVEENGNIVPPVIDLDDDYVPSDVALNKVRELREDAIVNFETYLQKAPNAEDVDEVKNNIKELKNSLENDN